MKILFATFHPVDPQIVRFVGHKLQSKGHIVLFSVVEKEGIISKLIESYGFSIKVIGHSRKSILGKFFNALFIDVNLLILCLKFKPTIIFSPASPYTGHIAMILRIKLICWGDTETATFNLNSSLPYIDSMLLPDCFYIKLESEKIIYFKSFKEIAYLHSKHFKSDPSIIQKLGIKDSEKIILMRFSALHAMHDIGLTSEVEKNESLILNEIHKLSDYARVFISCTERELGPEFEKYKLNIHPFDYLNLLSFCSLYIGEGTTTASEAGILGVPWINIQQTKRGYLIDQEENYGLGFRTNNLEVAFKTALNWIQRDNMKEEWALKRMKLLTEKIDFTSFLVWFIENYPESHKIMKNNPEYQNRFK